MLARWTRPPGVGEREMKLIANNFAANLMQWCDLPPQSPSL